MWSEFPSRFILHTAFSPQTGISDWSLVFFTLLYSSLPTIIVAIFDQYLSATSLLGVPQLYRYGQEGRRYNSTLFWVMIADTVWQSLVLFYVPYFSVPGTEGSLWSVGQIWTYGVTLLVNIHLALEINHWTWIHHAAMWLSAIGSFFIILILDLIVAIPQYGSLLNTANKASYWLQILLILILALLPRLLVKIVRQKFFPSDSQISYEKERLDERVKRKRNLTQETHLELCRQ